MMYKELVKDLMNKQREERKGLKETQAKEREATMINVLADIRTIAKELKCEYLLDNTQETVEQVVNKVVINKGKIVKVEVEKIVEKESNSDILKQAIASKDKYIIELEEQLSNKAYNAANDGYTVDGVEVSVAIVKELNSKINSLQEEIANIEKAKEETRNKAIVEYNKMKKTASTWQSKYNSLLNEFNKLKAQQAPTVEESNDDVYSDEYMAYLQEQQEVCESVVDEKAPVVEEPKQEVKAMELNKVNVNFKNKLSQAQLFRFNNGYVIGSPKIKELTYLPNVGHELTDAEKTQINDVLVRDFEFDAERAVMSPYLITRPNAYFARVNAIKGMDTFSKDDTFAGYVVIRNKYYLFTFIAKNQNSYVDDLAKLVAGETITRPSRVVRTEVDKLVAEMYGEYCAKLKVDGKDDELNKKEAEEQARKTMEKNAKAAADYKTELAKAKAQFNKGGDKKVETRGRRRQAPNLLSEDSFNSLEKGRAADYADMLI